MIFILWSVYTIEIQNLYYIQQEIRLKFKETSTTVRLLLREAPECHNLYTIKN